MSPKRNAPLTGKIARAVMGVAGALDGLPSPGMLIGGIAVILQGIPRMTRDEDATVEAASMDLDALALHFERHGIVPRMDLTRVRTRVAELAAAIDADDRLEQLEQLIARTTPPRW